MPRQLPEVLSVRRDTDIDGQILIDLHIPTDIVHFPGHFPGLAILPGVVQIDWAVRLARLHLPIDGQFTQMENIKFQSLILPDARVVLTLNWIPEKRRLEFSFSTSLRKHSSGRVIFGGGP
jgi:3-hydroxymyristoyl/3-hydroxydecanoyl-(acyl carrier protein) dehydratase